MAKSIAMALVALSVGVFVRASKLQSQSGSRNSPSDILKVLQAATNEKVQLSKDDIDKLGSALASANSSSVSQERKWVSTMVSRCNDNRYLERVGGTILNDAARECGFVGDQGLEYLGAANAQVELALQRACALPRSPELQDAWKIENYCAKLGDLYKSRGELDMALAVYEHAPNCQGDFGRAQSYAGTRCAVGAILVHRSLGNTSGEVSEMQKLCSVYTGDGLCPVTPAVVASAPRHPVRINPYITSTAKDFTPWTLSGTAYMADGSLALGGDKRLGTVFVIPLENSDAFNDCISTGTDVFNCAVGSRLFSINTEHDGSFTFQVTNDVYEVVGVETLWNDDGTKTESVGIVSVSVNGADVHKDITIR